MSNLIALIPARSGSRRLPGKNIQPLAGVPLLAYTIAAAREAGIFDRIYTSSDSERYGQIAYEWGARPIKRPEQFARDDSPDIEWIRHALEVVGVPDYFQILRPTSPFRTAETIRRAWEQYDGLSWMKAVQPVREHPWKMWFLTSAGMCPWGQSKTNIHAQPTQTLAKFYIQNACIEIRPGHDPEPAHFQPFFTEDFEGVDINDANDFLFVEMLVERGLAQLPRLEVKRWTRS